MAYQKRISRRVVHTTSGQYLEAASSYVEISAESSSGQRITWPKTVCNSSFVVAAKKKGETSHPLKVQLEKHWKGVIRNESVKTGMINPVLRQRRSPLCNEVKILANDENLKEGIAAYVKPRRPP